MPTRLPGKRVLIVEDSATLAYDLDDLFRDHGADVVGPALDLATGVRLAEGHSIDLAVLDIDLHGQRVWPVAQILRRDQVPFIFVSADCADERPEDYLDVICLDKPAATRHILDTAVRTMVGESA